MPTAEDLHRRGLAHTNAGRFGSARSLLTQALESAVDGETVARVKVSLSYVEAELGSTDAGLTLCAEALDVPALSTEVRGSVESQIGLLHMRAGAGQEALTAFASAISLLEDVPYSLAGAHLNRGLVFLQRGDAERAEDDARLAGELYRSEGHSMEAAKADHNLGYARLLAGDLVSALQLIDGAAPLLEVLSPTYRAVVSQDRAEVLVAAGMPTDAVVALEKAAKAYGVRRLRQRQAEVELILARTLAWDDPRRAAVVARRAERRFRQRGSLAWALRAEAVKIAAEIEALPASSARPARAVELADELGRQGLSHDRLLVTICAAHAQLVSGDVAAASTTLAGARPGATTPLVARLLMREVRSELAAAKGRRSLALDHVRRGLTELHEWQSSFGSLDLQSSLVGHGRRLAYAGLRLAVADGRPDVVFEWSERARTLTTRVTPVRPPSDPVAARALSELRRSPDEASAAVLRKRIRQLSWYGEGSGHVAEPLTLDEAAEVLAPSGGVLASYVLVDDELHCVVVGQGSREVVPLAGFARVRALLGGLQADLDMVAADLPPDLHDAVAAGLLRRVEDLATLLVAPLGATIDVDRLVIVPPAVLAAVPWSMLPGLRGRALTVPRSASLWALSRVQSRSVGAVGLVAGPRVARADEEVRLAAGCWPTAEVLHGTAAHASAVSELAERVDVLHVAAHGRHSADNPLFSGLELADGPWFGYDIDQLSAIPSTVILSACELGRSSVRWGAETLGMTVAWLHAGTRCVVAAPASVADDVACDVLSATHAGLAAGAPPAEALADAVRRLDARTAVSPFLCFGAGW